MKVKVYSAGSKKVQMFDFYLSCFTQIIRRTGFYTKEKAEGSSLLKILRLCIYRFFLILYSEVFPLGCCGCFSFLALSENLSKDPSYQRTCVKDLPAQGHRKIPHRNLKPVGDQITCLLYTSPSPRDCS